MLGDCYASAIIEHYSRDELTAGERLPLHQEVCIYKLYYLYYKYYKILWIVN